MRTARKLFLAPFGGNSYQTHDLQAAAWLRLTFTFAAAGLLASCAAAPALHTASAPKCQRVHVRTTAYCKREGTSRNAVGEYLSGRIVRSAASDWSRFPIGTRFRVVGTTEEYIIDDYGAALIGTNTIDLYKTSMLAMQQWGVRHVDIDILQWGSDAQSVKVLTPRARNKGVRKMLLALNKKKPADRQL
ncbi:MAG: hypothetical protein JO354_01745 [Verrucomicrobia bacterium]|nr:hypothetical protein [Verrucomicrobiota bacterium]